MKFISFVLASEKPPSLVRIKPAAVIYKERLQEAKKKICVSNSDPLVPHFDDRVGRRRRRMEASDGYFFSFWRCDFMISIVFIGITVLYV